MPQTPHDFSGPLLEQEIQFDDQYGILPTKEGALLYSDGYFLAEDQYGVFNLRQDGGAGALPNHANNHITDGSDEIDGDQLDIDFTPTFYSPITSPPEASDADHLAAHLAGIDAYLGVLQNDNINEDEHRGLRHLIHFIDDGPALKFASGAFKETLPAGSPFPTSIIWWESASKTDKIVELTVTRTIVFPTIEEWKMYDTDGSTVLETVTDTITYSGPFEISRTRTIA